MAGHVSHIRLWSWSPLVFHSSVVRASNRYLEGRGFDSHWGLRKFFFWVFPVEKVYPLFTLYPSYQSIYHGKTITTNSRKTKAIFISTPQMAHVHSHWNLELGLEISGTHSSILKSCYATLRTWRKIWNFTDFKLRKHLVETLILSKISYCFLSTTKVPLS